MKPMGHQSRRKELNLGALQLKRWRLEGPDVDEVRSAERSGKAKLVGAKRKARPK